MNRKEFMKGSCLTIAGMGILPNGFANRPSEKFMIGWPKQIKKPQKLKENDTMGLITPSSAISRKALETALENMATLGFRVKYSDNIKIEKDFLKGTDQQCIDDIHAMFLDEQVNGIFCARGGYGSARLLPHLDYELIAAHPKALIGYSDITALHFGIFSQTGLVSFHGPVGTSNFTDYTYQHFKATVMEGKKNIRIEQAEEDINKTEDYIQMYSISEGIAKGQLVGGNLSLITSLIGTPFDLDFTEKIIFIEEVGESPYRIDRMLTQLLLTGKLSKASGIVLGLFIDCDHKKTTPDFEKTISLKKIFEERLRPLDIPVFYGLSFGHANNNATFPMGIMAELNTYTQSLTLCEKAVL